MELRNSDKQNWQAQLSVFAAKSGDQGALEGYVANCRNLDAKDADGLALIHYAACHGNIPLLRLLSEHGADMNLPDGGSPAWKPVHYAIFHNQTEAEQILRTFGAEPPLPILTRIVAEKLSGPWGARETATEAERSWSTTRHAGPVAKTTAQFR